MDINSTMKLLYRHTRVFTFLLTLLLLGGVANKAWADVTYHILTLPFTTKKTDGSDFKSNIRAEALRVVVKATDNGGKVGLPAAYKSPLLNDAAYKYYKTATVTSKVKIYQNNSTQLDTYSEISNELTAGESTVADNDHIYVTYTYDPSSSTICTPLGQSIKLDGTEAYNIEVDDKNGDNKAFLALNVLRGNRPSVLTADDPYNIDDITSTEPTEVKNGIYNDYDKKWGKTFYYRFKFQGSDPYNFKIVVAYDGTATYLEKEKSNAEVPIPIKINGDDVSNMIWSHTTTNGADKMWLSYDSNYEWDKTNKTWKKKEGYYKNSNPIFDSFILLNHATANYTLIGSKINANGNNWQPNGSGYYTHLNNEALNPLIKTMKATDAPQIKIHKMKEYVFKVKTPLSNTVLSQVVCVSDYSINDNPKDHVPDALKRKYVTFTGAYKEQGFTNQYATFAAVDAEGSAETDGGRKVIWLKYESTLPFTKAAAGATYDNLTWYNFYTNKDDQYIVRYNSTDAAFNTKGTDGSRYARTSHFAFIGDPFELKIVSRKVTDDNSGTLHYLKLKDPITGNITNDATGTSWDIIYDDNTEDYAGCFRLREFTTTNNSTNYLAWNYGNGNYPLIGATAQDNAVRLMTIAVPQKNYVYHIMRGDNSIAAKATISQDASTKLDYAHIPEIIRSPFLALPGVTLKFYDTAGKASAQAASTDITYAPDASTDGTQDIWVRYDMGSALTSAPAKLDGSQEFNVQLNGEYIYYDNGTIKSTADISSHASEDAYLWVLGGADPYAMTIKNKGANKLVQIAVLSNGVISWADTGSKFIVKQGTNSIKNYEVMAATGDEEDAATTYYNIGREGTTVRAYKNTEYAHGYSQIRFLLTASTAHDVTYHLIDLSNHELLTVKTRQAEDETPHFPEEYWSPLVDTYSYWNDANKSASVATVGNATDIYVTYTTKSVADGGVDLKKGVLYLLKFNAGDNFRQEDGHDNLTSDPVKAIYPYCNGDCNFFVYGQSEYELQQQGAASTRTRWAWYVESANDDPYHVKICSRQQETFPAGSGNNYNAYFRTYLQNYGGSGHVVTTLAWPGITGEQETEYMVLGSTGMYRLVTTDLVNGSHQTVKSFEQYWKTYDTVKNKLLKDILADKDKGANPTGATTVPNDPAAYRELLTGTGEGQYGFHSYAHWAYAKRFNGYNADGKTSKGWEEIEHWYQTVNMGEGYFDFVKTSIDPALILLDQHGWEIMRKPLPSDPNDPDKEAKYEALGAYDSPMVKEYIFWSSASKRTGLHQYYKLNNRIGGDFTSTTLTNLPPYDSQNVLDAKGNLNDQYVTYIVKDEYAQSYTYDNGQWNASTFLIQQGDKYVSTTDGATITKTTVPVGGMSQAIISANGNFTNGELWYLRPNTAIDNEQGYLNVAHDWGSNKNAYEVEAYAHQSTAQLINDNTLGKFSFSNGFDPYNIQIESASQTGKYFVTNATGTKLDNGQMDGVYSETAAVSLGSQKTVSATWYDNAPLTITNTTFMAVLDEDGSMQLVPRFDHANRVRDFDKLEKPIGEESKLNEMKTQLFRPLIYNYHIVDNSGQEALHYKSGGDLRPQTPEWFQSQLAKDYTYHTAKPCTNENMIKESLEGASLTGNNVYVRYSYDESTDVNRILQGNWLTMTLNGKNAIYSEGLKQAGGDKPETVDGDDRTWQWKFTANPQSEPDPYAVSLYSRSQTGATTISDKTTFVLLNWYDSNGIDPNFFTLAVAGTGPDTYEFVNGADMTPSAAATTATESGVTGASCSYDGTKAKIVLNDEVEHTFAYQVYTNGGVLAISENQSHSDLINNEFVPVIPEAAHSPLLNFDDFRYYNKDDYERIVESKPDTIGKNLSHLYGLYDDVVIVRYLPYNPDNSHYKVPNDKTVESGHAARGPYSNDASLDINDRVLYNVIWYNDNMMKRNGATIDCTADQADLKAESDYEWKFVGNDPYAFKIQDVGQNSIYTSDNSTCTLSDENATTFMLLNHEGYEYGVLAKTGAKRYQLSGYGNTMADTEAATPQTPTQFIIFGLATHKVIYHLVIAPTATNTENPETGCYETIPYWDGTSITTKNIPGSTQRDLSTTYQLGTTINGQNYSFDAGHISLGSFLEVPSVFYRPNVVYDFYVEGIYSETDCAEGHAIPALNGLYKGRKVDHMGDNTDLLGKTVRINIVYTFNGELNTNSGSDFVRSVADNKWYTFETANGDTPWLAQFTNAWGLEVKEGRGTHYTNDYLWSPLGDPYGFRMYNRYIYKNSGASNTGEDKRVMTTTGFSEEQPVSMTDGNSTEPTNDPNNVYELLPATTDGYFYVHPVVNTGTEYYLRTKEYNEVGKKGTFVILSETPTEFTFGLSNELVKPYFDKVGYVGGLKKTVYDEHSDIANAIKNGTTLTMAQLMQTQTLVYDDANIEPFVAGYYRLHSPAGISGIEEERYASGYTHKTEETAAVPMHFYEKEGASTQFNLLKSKDGSSVNAGYTSSVATRGDIPIPAVEYDPASIFYITGTYDNAKMSTQGLFVKGETGKTGDDGTPTETIEAEGVRAKAIMTSAEESASPLWIMDIGGAVMLIHDRAIPRYRKYLSYDQTDADHIYDLKLTHNSHTDHAKWCLQPANNLGLRITTHSGGDGGTYSGNTYNYSTFYAPFDILLPNDVPNASDPSKNDKQYKAFICDSKHSSWPTIEAPKTIGELHPRPIEKYNIEANSCPSTFRGSNKFVPAGTPVLIAAIDDSGYIKATIPTSAPSQSLVTGFQENGDATTRDNILSGQYLEQKLAPGNDVYVFGVPYTGDITPASDYATSGNIDATLPLPDNSGIGFFKNANPNKEADPSRSNWKRNNWYVLGNKIYYRASGGSPARGVEFVPVVFKSETTEIDGVREYRADTPYPGGVYNLQGRCVATEEQVLDGTWRQHLAPGIYIMNGRSIIVK